MSHFDFGHSKKAKNYQRNIKLVKNSEFMLNSGQLELWIIILMILWFWCFDISNIVIFSTQSPACDLDPDGCVKSKYDGNRIHEWQERYESIQYICMEHQCDFSLLLLFSIWSMRQNDDVWNVNGFRIFFSQNRKTKVPQGKTIFAKIKRHKTF